MNGENNLALPYPMEINNRLERMEKDMDKLIEIVNSKKATNFDNGINCYTSVLPTEGEHTMATNRIKKRVQLGTDEHGQPITQWITADSEQEFIERAATIFVNAGMLEKTSSAPARNNHPFKATAENYMVIYSKGKVRAITYQCYKQAFDKHVVPFFSGKNIEEITWRDIETFYNERKDMTTETLRKFRTVLNIVFKGAMKDGYISQNPVSLAEFKGKRSGKRNPLTREQMKEILRHIPDVKNETDRRYLALVVSTGMNPEEILGLRWEDFNMQDKCFFIQRAVTHPTRNQPEISETKEEARDRILKLNPCIEKYVIPDVTCQGFLFGGETPYSYQRFKRMFDRIKKQVNLYGATSYTLRHTVLTDIYDETKDVKATQAIAGHATPDMTMKRYVHGRKTNYETSLAFEKIYGVS